MISRCSLQFVALGLWAFRAAAPSVRLKETRNHELAELGQGVLGSDRVFLSSSALLRLQEQPVVQVPVPDGVRWQLQPWIHPLAAATAATQGSAHGTPVHAFSRQRHSIPAIPAVDSEADDRGQPSPSPPFASSPLCVIPAASRREVAPPGRFQSQQASALWSASFAILPTASGMFQQFTFVASRCRFGDFVLLAER